MDGKIEVPGLRAHTFARVGAPSKFHGLSSFPVLSTIKIAILGNSQFWDKPISNCWVYIYIYIYQIVGYIYMYVGMYVCISDYIQVEYPVIPVPQNFRLFFGWESWWWSALIFWIGYPNVMLRESNTCRDTWSKGIDNSILSSYGVSTQRNLTAKKPHSTEASQQRNYTAKKSHSKEISQQRSLTAEKPHCKEITQQRSHTAKKAHSREASLQRSLTAKKPHSKEITQQRNLTAETSHCKEVPQQRSLTAEKSHS